MTGSRFRIGKYYLCVYLIKERELECSDLLNFSFKIYGDFIVEIYYSRMNLFMLITLVVRTFTSLVYSSLYLFPF